MSHYDRDENDCDVAGARAGLGRPLKVGLERAQ